MTTPSRRLYQFPLSLYCEKTRWNLDHKQLAYQCSDLIPGLHLPVARMVAGISTLPVLRDAQGTVGDSTRIALWLERHYPQHSLLPMEPVSRERVLAHEMYFDEIGDHVRRCVWSLAVDGPRIDHVFYGFSGYSAATRAFGRVSIPLLRRMLRWRFRLQPARATNSWARVHGALDYIETLLAGNPEQYLVDDRFTLADLTAATMLAPLIGPPGSPWSDERLGIEIDRSGRDMYRQRVAGRWVMNMYGRHRGG